jgi:glutaminyl-peptide cyclotransferase
MNAKIFKPLAIGLVALCLQACEGEKEKSSASKTKVTEKQVKVPDFNADSAYAFIEKQLSFGPRVPNTKGHQACGDFLVEELQGFGAKVQQQQFEARAYDGTVLYLRNIIASFDPQKSKRILLAAHWDTRHVADKDTENRDQPIPGANDGGSGVGVLLEIARVLSTTDHPEVGIDLILFDGEDYGAPEDYEGRTTGITYCLGSQHWAKNKHQANYSAYYGILLDMVGAENAQFYQEGNSRHYAPKIVKKIWDKANEIGYSRYFPYANSDGIMDDHVPINEYANIPMVDIIAYDPGSPENYFPDYHHTHKDDLSIISKSTLEAVGETVLHVVYNE